MISVPQRDVYEWVAELSDGSVVHEQPLLSSDTLPRDSVAALSYRPTANPAWPTIRCEIDLAAGERFVRCWSNVLSVQSGRLRRLYVVGWERSGGCALLIWYPEEQKAVFANSRTLAPPAAPNTFALLPRDVLVRGGLGAGFVGWQVGDVSAYLISAPGGLIFRSSLHR